VPVNILFSGARIALGVRWAFGPTFKAGISYFWRQADIE
jgi:hypothetical protein